MRRAKFQPNRRTRERIFLAWAVLSLAVWLFMAAAEIYSPLHAWLHGGSVPDDDNCAIVAITHGKIETTPVAAPVLLATIGIEIIPRVEVHTFVSVSKNLPQGRAPPVFCS